MSQQSEGAEGGNYRGRCRIVLADDHELMREGIAAVIARQPEFTICGVAADRRMAGELVARHRPHVLLIDLSMTERDEPRLLQDLITNFPGTRVLVLAAYAEERYVERVLNRGAAGYFIKSASGSQLIKAIQTVAAGEIYTSPRVASVVRQRGTSPTGMSGSIRQAPQSV